MIWFIINYHIILVPIYLSPLDRWYLYYPNADCSHILPSRISELSRGTRSKDSLGKGLRGHWEKCDLCTNSRLETLHHISRFTPDEMLFLESLSRTSRRADREAPGHSPRAISYDSMRWRPKMETHRDVIGISELLLFSFQLCLLSQSFLSFCSTFPCFHIFIAHKSLTLKSGLESSRRFRVERQHWCCCCLFVVASTHQSSPFSSRFVKFIRSWKFFFPLLSEFSHSRFEI